MTDRGGSKKKSKMRHREDPDMIRRIQRKQEILMNILSPTENWIMRFQSFLIWETPHETIALWLFLHVLLWIITLQRIFFVIGMVGMTIVAVDMWRNHIWPEIRVPSAHGEDEEWTPVDPRFLSVPEICHSLAWYWVKALDFVISAIHLRKTNRPKFFIFTMLALLSVAAFGSYIPGIYLSHFTVLFCFLWPGFVYNDGLVKLKEICGPVLANFETKLKIKRTRTGSKRDKKKHGADPNPQVALISDSDSEEIEEFVPQPNVPETAATLETALTDSEDEGGLTPGLLTPPHIPSKNPSREHSDVEEGSTAEMDDLGSLATGLNTMPSYEDTLETSYTNDLDDTIQLEQELEEAIGEEDGEGDCDSIATPPSVGTSDSSDAMKFIPGYFSDTGSEGRESSQDVIDESQLAENMSFPDINDDSSLDNTDSGTSRTHAMVLGGLSMLTSQGQSLVSQGQALVSALHNPAVSETVSNLVVSTMAGLSTLKTTVVGTTPLPCTCPTEGAESSNPDCPRHKGLMDSLDSQQLEAEFEFLNQEDLEHVDHDKDNTEK